MRLYASCALTSKLQPKPISSLSTKPQSSSRPGFSLGRLFASNRVRDRGGRGLSHQPWSLSQVIDSLLYKVAWLFPGYNALLANYSSVAFLASNPKDASQPSPRLNHQATGNEDGEAGVGVGTDAGEV